MTTKRWQSLALVAMAACASTEGQQDALHPETLQSGGARTPLQQRYDVLHYELELEVDPNLERIDGTMAIRLKAIAPLQRVELDLDPRFDLGTAQQGIQAIDVERDEDKVRLLLKQPLAQGDVTTVSLSYGGEPYEAENPPWDGGFVWERTKNNEPWLATAVQGRGCDLWWPCKDYYGDKPDEGIDFIVTVPQPLVVAMNGVLIDQTTTAGLTTYHWRSPSPHTGYAIALNAGPFTLINDTFESRNGSSLPIAFYALPENSKKARMLIETDAKPHLRFFEDLVGPYPWREEKVGFVETPHLGMEHQTINAYGQGYKPNVYGFDWLMHHELAHEWFGNAMTHARPEDMWLHEGYALYMQPLYTRATRGEAAFRQHMEETYRQIENIDPVVVPGAPHIDAAISNSDVYYKGAWTLHTLRWLVGEDAFWRATRRLVYGTATPWQGFGPWPGYRSTADFTAILSEEAGQDLSGIIGAYLYLADLPSQLIERRDDELRLSWENTGPYAFHLPVPIAVTGRLVIVSMEGGEGRLKVGKDANVVIDPEAQILRRRSADKSIDYRS
ncbi:MAG: M1 family metallopeptidase [Pseudomonadota bacterium]